MNQTTMSKMNQMKFYGMHGAFKTAIETGKTDHYTLDQFVAQLIDAEWDDRHNRKIARNIKNAKFRYKASVENIIYGENRNLERNKLLRLADGSFINNGEDILITGSTGVGKSYIATALGYQACIEGNRVMYCNTARLFAKLKMHKADGSYLKELAKIERHQLLIIDDFGLQTMDNQSRMAFLEIIEDRHGKGSTIITSQLPVSKWYEIIGEKTIADAILDRLVHHAHRIELDGESMRKKQNKESITEYENEVKINQFAKEDSYMNHSFLNVKMTGQHGPEWVGQHSRNFHYPQEVEKSLQKPENEYKMALYLV